MSTHVEAERRDKMQDWYVNKVRTLEGSLHQATELLTDWLEAVDNQDAGTVPHPLHTCYRETRAFVLTDGT